MNIKKYTLLLICLLLTGSSLFSQTTQTIYLSGTGYGHTSSWDFFCTGGRKSGYWTQIEVPSCWEQQGFGNYNYGRDYKTYGKNYRFFDEQGIYRKKFRLPAAWKERSIAIVFEGSMTDTEVKINGRSAGEIHRGAFYRFRYDISKLVQFNTENILEVKVSKMSSDKSVNNAERLADYWIFGGIYRPVYLEAKPAANIAGVAIKAAANGDFHCSINGNNWVKGQQLTGQILDARNRTVATFSQQVTGNDSLIQLSVQVPAALAWTSETPHLYTLQLQLRSGSRIIHTLQQAFGFRTIEIKNGEGIFINGVQVKMKGVNRHCFWPESGRTLNDSISLADVVLLKQMNMNAVRCSHYPPDEKFLDYCDSLGIYVIDELAGWQKAYSTQAGTPLVKEMLLRDRNHPSVIFWANGNEGGSNKALDTVFREWDLSGRPVIHPHHRPGNAFSGIDCDHYEDYYSTKKKLEEGSYIYMPTEMLHSQDDGGGGAGMHDFWELHWKSKLSGGVFVWAMLDEAIRRTDFNNRLDANGLNANDGILGPYREKEGSYYALRDIFSPVKLISRDSNALTIENRYHFSNLSQCRFQWQLINYATPFYNDSAYTIFNQGSIASPVIAPGRQGQLPLVLPAGYRQYDALIINTFDAQDNCIARWFIRIKNNRQISGQLAESFLPVKKEAPVFTENDSLFSITAAGISIQLEKKTGMLFKVANSNAAGLSFNKGPVATSGPHFIDKATVMQTGDSIAVLFSAGGNMQQIRWTMYNTGWVKLDYRYKGSDSTDMAGISFNYPENYILGASWLGKGPSRQWRNRIDGTERSVYSNLYNNTQTGYSPVIYPEFKGYYGDMSWMQFNTVEGNFLVCFPEENMFVRLFDFYGLTGPRSLPVLPPGNISFMDIIPAIGTKLALNINDNTASLGPQGNKAAQAAVVEHTLLFYFGTPVLSSKKETYSRPATDEVF
ncbi:MAG: glycoside hydrolase family 2 TIM barrel-domain containing protein [Ferruginibacter sp.]